MEHYNYIILDSKDNFVGGFFSREAAEKTLEDVTLPNGKIRYVHIVEEKKVEEIVDSNEFRIVEN